PFAAGTLALGLCFGAYATEVFRGALLSIPRGHREAGQALGLSPGRIFWRIVLPQIWRVALPGLGNLYLILLKDTALVSLITLDEIMRKAQVASNATKEPFTFYMTAAAIYLSLTVVIMVALHFLERRAGRGFVRNEL
ncbi:ABC transporter permease subunit, partial [Pseudomonas aeruginosa]